MDFTTAAALLELCESQRLSLAQAMVRRETGLFETAEEAVRERLAHSLEIMKDAAAAALAAPQKTMGGLIGGEAVALEKRRAAAIAMGTLEVNASMGLIVAAPTAGSCGVLPGALLSQAEEYGFSDEELIDALLCASAVGYLIARNATIAGAQGGCQAEVGSASAMAAAAVVQLHGGTPRQSLAAAGIALVGLMGLVCDPIGGLVESPCQGRNATGAAQALVAAEEALAGIGAPVPLDEVIAAMYAVGRSLPRELRETALGGIAAVPSACSRCGGCG